MIFPILKNKLKIKKQIPHYAASVIISKVLTFKIGLFINTATLVLEPNVSEVGKGQFFNQGVNNISTVSLPETLKALLPVDASL